MTEPDDAELERIADLIHDDVPYARSKVVRGLIGIEQAQLDRLRSAGALRFITREELPHIFNRIETGPGRPVRYLYNLEDARSRVRRAASGAEVDGHQAHAGPVVGESAGHLEYALTADAAALEIKHLQERVETLVGERDALKHENRQLRDYLAEVLRASAGFLE